jgi:hypothetical protein
LFFPVLARLQTKPNGHDFCVADYSPDRIVFHVENKPAEFVALVSSFHFRELFLSPDEDFIS